MNKFPRSLAAAAALLLATSAPAFADDENFTAPSDETITEALEWASSTEQTAPQFTIKTLGGKAVFGVGGMVKATGNFDFGATMDNPNEFFTSAIPVGAEKGNGGRVGISAAQTTLYFSGAFLPGSRNQVGVYVNVNFMGENYLPALQYACLRWRFITAGFAYSTFADNEAMLPTIDYQGPNSFTGIQNAVINFEGNLTKDGLLSGGIGLDAPIASYEDYDYSRNVSQRLPDIPAYLQLNFTGEAGGHVRFSAIMRNLYYRNTFTNKNNDKIGWGVKLSGAGKIFGPVTGFFQALYGKGITSYYQDLTDCGLDLVARGDNGSMTTLKSWGGYAGLMYDITDRFHLSGAYSHIRLYPGEDCVMPDLETTYRYAQYAVGTLTYDVNSWLQAGVEYVYGRRVQLDGAQAHDNRLLLGLTASF